MGRFHLIFRGRRASKLTEEEEDEEYLMEEEGAIPGSGGTRLLTQPSFKYLNVAPLYLEMAHNVASQFLHILWKFC